MQTTITEALADLKTIAARLMKKREAVLQYLARDARVRDPHERDGGTVQYVDRELQGVGDLERRIVRIRAAIQQANHATSLTIGTQTMTVADWLSWRREVAPNQRQFLNTMATHIQKFREQAHTQRLAVKDGVDTGNPGDLVIAVSETALRGQIENIETVLGTLDGKLSLLNATTTFTIPD